jgi:hypothetical protein
MMNTDIQISFVVPVAEQAGTVESFLRGLITEADRLGSTYEIVVVDDGSSDETDTILRRIEADFGCLRILQLSRAFGVDVALTAGVEASAGSVVITFDRHCDDWPTLVGSLLEANRQGAEVVDVLGPKTAPVSLVARLDRLVGASPVVGASDMRLIARPVIDSIKASGWNVCLPEALSKAGFRQKTIRHETTGAAWCAPAPEAKPTWRFWAMWGACAGLLATTVILLIVALGMTVTGHGSLGMWGVTLFGALLTVQLVLVTALMRQVGLQRKRLSQEKLYIVRDTTRQKRDDLDDDASHFTSAGYVVYT